MGSLFYINVPIREHEIVLRQREHQIVISKEIDPSLRDGFAGGSRLSLGSSQISSTIQTQRGRGHGRSASSDNLSQATSSQMTSAPRASITSGGSSIDIDYMYEGTAEGKKVKILVSQDTMEVLGLAPDKSDNKGKTSEERDMDTMQNTINKTFLEKHLEACLQKFVIYDATWGTSIDGNFAQVSFTVNADRAEEIINYMLTLGIGLKYESTLSVCSAIVYYNEKQEEKKKKLKELEDGTTLDQQGEKKTFGAKFVASIKSRLTVAQVIQSVQSNAVMTFDFIVLIIVAGIIAGLGLLENSSVNLVASMLISPLMGPIMAGCFGAVIRDWKLVKIGVISEVVGLSLCLLVGFFFGICVAWHPFDGPWADVDKWPTDEMVARSRLRGMVVGVFIAIPSGAGVALSILAGNAGSLVGVAISASLLPPAVNAGLFWGMASVISLMEQADGRSVSIGCEAVIGPNSTRESSPYTTRYVPVYCQNVLHEFAIMGIVSFGLTILNIVLILITGAIVLKIKEVAPHTTRKTMSRFWKEDLKAMRDYNKEHGGFNQQAFFNEIRNAEDSGLKIKLANDHIYNQVTRRNVFGNGVDILQSAEDRGVRGGDVESGGGEGKEPSVHHHGTGGMFTGIFNLFGHRSAVDSEIASPDVGSPRPSSPHML